MTDFRGVYNIMATPFDADGAVDAASIRTLVDFQLAAGADGLTILGIMGEAHKLTDEERLLVTSVVLEHAAGRCPVVVGASGGSAEASIWLGRHAARLGAAAVMCAPPVNLRNLDVVYGYFERVAGALTIPVVVQDEPVQTGVQLPAAFLARLCNEIPGCAAIKLEDEPTPPKISRVRAELRREVPIFGGLGGMQFYYELRRGATGTMTGFAFTEILVAIYRAHDAGETARAREIYARYLPLIAYEGQRQIGLSLRKEILHRRGAIANAAIRAPGMTADRESLAELDEILAALGLTGGEEEIARSLAFASGGAGGKPGPAATAAVIR